MTDTIGWGEVDERPRRLPRVRLNRRRRVALLVVAALVAGGVVAWPSFRSWRADAGARQVLHIWAQAQGFDNARVLALVSVQSTLNTLDRPVFARAVAAVDVEEASDLDRLRRQADAMRTWTADVSAARGAVVRALAEQATGLRQQASRPAAARTDQPATTWADDRALTAADAAGPIVDRLRARHHLKPVPPPTERFHSAAATLAALHRPTDDLLHLRLVTAGPDGLTITDLDTGRVVRRGIDTGDPVSWQPQRLFGTNLVGSADFASTVIIPLRSGGHEHVLPDVAVQSSTGSPMWVWSVSTGEMHAVDASGRAVSPVTQLPDGLALTGFGTGSVLLATNPAEGSIVARAASRYFLFHPRTRRTTKLAVAGCPQLPAFDGGVVVVPTGDLCDFPSELQLFDLSGHLVRTVPIPAGETTAAPPICSPDGKHIAVSTAPRPTAQDPDRVAPAQLRLLDTTTGSWSTVPGSEGWIPVGWSPDGATLMVQLIDSTRFTPGQQYGQLAYLRSGDLTLHSIRVTADLANYLL